MTATATESTIALPDIERGFLRCYYIYDVADKIELAKISSSIGEGVERARLDLKTSAAPGYIQYAEAPLQASFSDLHVDGYKASGRVRIFDHGTITIRISISYNGSFDDFARAGRRLRQSDALKLLADDLFKTVMRAIESSCSKPYKEIITEDYFVFSILKFSKEISGAALLHFHREKLAGMLLSEARPLSEDEQNEALRIHYSYFADDLVLVEWDAAFVYDNEADTEASESILEFANVQLVQYLTYDKRLDNELADIYRLNLVRLQGHWLRGKDQIEKRAERLRYILVDIREIADHATNALKMIGDAFYARLYRGASLRLGLPDWQEQIEHKIDSIQEIYQFIEHQSQYAQSATMELIIIVLILVEVVMGLLTLFAAGK